MSEWRPPTRRRGVRSTTESIVGVEFRLHRVGQWGVADDVLYVVGVCEAANEPDYLARRLGVDPDREVRHELRLRRVVLDARLLERGPRRHEIGGFGHDLEAAAVVL